MSETFKIDGKEGADKVALEWSESCHDSEYPIWLGRGMPGSRLGIKHPTCDDEDIVELQDEHRRTVQTARISEGIQVPPGEGRTYFIRFHPAHAKVPIPVSELISAKHAQEVEK